MLCYAVQSVKRTVFREWRQTRKSFSESSAYQSASEDEADGFTEHMSDGMLFGYVQAMTLTLCHLGGDSDASVRENLSTMSLDTPNSGADGRSSSSRKTRRILQDRRPVSHTKRVPSPPQPVSASSPAISQHPAVTGTPPPEVISGLA